jgi:HPt (histidine-containing phosphotransfer) domain-containing protein
LIICIHPLLAGLVHSPATVRAIDTSHASQSKAPRRNLSPTLAALALPCSQERAVWGRLTMAGRVVDFAYLEGYAGGDALVVAEVLALFQEQAVGWLSTLDEPDGWRDRVHTIKGSARGIGANALGDVADVAEQGDAAMAPQVRAALIEALADIEAYLTKVGGA